MRDLTRLAAWSRRLLFAQAAVTGLAILLALGHGPGFDDPDGSDAYLFVAAIQLVIFVGAAIPVLRWTYFSNANAHAMGAENLSAGPKMAVGWYFVPVATLVMPFRSMREVWQASVSPRDWEAAPGSPLLGWWWGAWLIGNATGMAALRIDMDDRFAAAAPVAERLTTVSDALTIVASLLLARIIAIVTERQETLRVPAI